MNAKNISDLQRRFQKIGFDVLGKELQCEAQIYVDGSHICAEFYAASGKLSFVLDMEGDVDPVTLNMNTYTAIWQGNIQIEAAIYEGVSTNLLENRFRQLTYMADTASEKAKVIIDNIMADLKKLALSKKPEAVRVYNHFLAKYGAQFQLGELKVITGVRVELQEQYTVKRKFSLQSVKLVLPIVAYQQMKALFAKALKKH